MTTDDGAESDDVPAVAAATAAISSSSTSTAGTQPPPTTTPEPLFRLTENDATGVVVAVVDETLPCPDPLDGVGADRPFCARPLGPDTAVSDAPEDRLRRAVGPVTAGDSFDDAFITGIKERAGPIDVTAETGVDWAVDVSPLMVLLLQPPVSALVAVNLVRTIRPSISATVSEKACRRAPIGIAAVR